MMLMQSHTARTIGYLLQHTAAILARQNDRVLQERLGIGFSQCKLLLVLRHNPSTEQREIATWLGQTEASISRQIKIMADAGLLTNMRDRHNKRRHQTALTAKGVTVTDQAMQILDDQYTAAFSALEGKDHDVLVQSLRSVHNVLCQSGSACTIHQQL